MIATFLKNECDETTGITTFIYSVIGTEEELSDYSLLTCKYYGMEDGKPAYSSHWYYGKEDDFGKHSKKGYYFLRQQLFLYMEGKFGENSYKMLSDLFKDRNWLLYEKNLKRLGRI